MDQLCKGPWLWVSAQYLAFIFAPGEEQNTANNYYKEYATYSIGETEIFGTDDIQEVE